MIYAIIAGVALLALYEYQQQWQPDTAMPDSLPAPGSDTTMTLSSKVQLPFDVQQIIEATAPQYGVPVELALAQCWQESRGKITAVSSAGAQGLFQLMPATARGLGVTNPFDPQQSVTAGCKYMAQQFARFGTWELALAAYNAGAGNVLKYHSTVPPFPETETYVQKIFAYAGWGAPDATLFDRPGIVTA